MTLNALYGSNYFQCMFIKFLTSNRIEKWLLLAVIKSMNYFGTIEYHISKAGTFHQEVLHQ